MTPYDLRDRDEKLNDEQAEIHDAEHNSNPDPRCWRCEERAAHLCHCGHDLDDEHRVIPGDDGGDYLMCNSCLDECCVEIGEREAYEAKVKL